MTKTPRVRVGGWSLVPQPVPVSSSTAKRISQRWKERGRWALGAALTLLAISSPAIAQTVTVNCGARYDEFGSGVDDLAKIRGYYDTATLLPETGPILRETRWRMDQLKAHSFRSIHDEDGSQMSGSTFVPSSSFLAALDRYKNQAMVTPHIVVGLVKPSHMVAPFAPNNIDDWTATDWDHYGQYCEALIRYVMTTYRGGWQEVRFEITNEAEVHASIWSASGSWNPGDPHLYEGFFKIYREWALAASRVAATTSKDPRVIGPVTGVGGLLYWTNYLWYDWFIDDVVTENLRLDGFTLHFYGPSDPIGSQPDYYGNRMPFANMITTFRNKLIAAGRGNTPLYITEWGACDWFSRTDLMEAVNATPVGGAWTAAMLRAMLTNKIDDAVHLFFRENEGVAWDRVGPVATFNQVTYPKPAFNVMRMFSALPGERKQISTSNWNNDLGAIAGANSNQIGVLVHNFDFDANTVAEMTSPMNVTVAITGSSLNGTQTARRYVVDSNHSNVDKFLPLATGTLPPIQECELQLVETTTVVFSGGAATLPARTVDQSGVSLWLIGGPAIPEGDLVGDYTIKNSGSGKYLDVANSTSGTYVVQNPPSGGLSQIWTLTDIGGGYYKIVNKSSNLALTIQGGSTANGAQTVQQAYTGAQQQIFVVRQSDAGLTHRIIASHSGRILENASNPNNGVPASQWPFTVTQPAHQQWVLKSTAEVKIEAETGSTGNGATVSPNGGASGGQAVGSMHGAGAFVQLSGIANPNPSGLTKIDIVYASAEADPPKLKVYLNGSATPAATLTCAGTSSWTSATGIVSLSAPLSSSNTIKIEGGQRGIDIDYVKLSPTK